MLVMRAINEFEIRYHRTQGDPLVAAAAANDPSLSHLPNLPRAQNPSFALFYRGRVLTHLPACGEQIEAQFETEHGYLLLISAREGAWFFSSLHVCFLLRDMSIADVLSINTWDTGKAAEPAWVISFILSVHLAAMAEDGPPPLNELIVESECSLLLSLRNRGWYRLTLYDKPLKLRFSSFSVRHHISNPFQSRHVRAVRFPPWALLPQQARDADRDRHLRLQAAKEHERARDREATPPSALGVEPIQHLGRLVPIDDFESGDDYYGDARSDSVDPTQRPRLSTPPASEERLDLRHRDAWNWDFGTLLFRGHLIPNIRVGGEVIEAQYRTPRGYLLFLSGGGYPMIYYIPADFSGAEWATVLSWKGYETERIESDGVSNQSALKGSQYLRFIELEDDRHLQLYIYPRGWYRLTLFEDPPRRFKFSDEMVFHKNSALAQPRYFRILKHRRRSIEPIPARPDFCDLRLTLQQWQAWHAALDRANVGRKQRRAFADIYAVEMHATGGDRDSRAGIDRTRLATIGPAVGVSPSIPLDDLTVDQLVALYVGWFDRALAAVGGADSLEGISDEYAAGALADVLFELGGPQGVVLVQRAVNSLETMRVLEDGVFGPVTFAAFCDLSADALMRARLLLALAENRSEHPKSNASRTPYFAFRDIDARLRDLEWLRTWHCRYPKFVIVAMTKLSRLRRRWQSFRRSNAPPST